MSMILFVGLVLFLWWCFSSGNSGGNSRSAGWAVTDSRSRRHTSLHEAGHYVVAKRRGSSGVSAWLESDRAGWTQTGTDRSVLDAAVITAAGTEATNRDRWFTEPTTSGDARILHRKCRQAGITPAEARRLARRDVARYQGEIRKVADRLYRDGRV